MHVAICDDNVADRKQLERLLSREADIRKSKGETLYIDSFGDISALMRAPKIYDVFFIDMTGTKDEDGLYVANLLRTDTITAPIVLCSSSIDYEACHSTLSNLLYLKKQVKASEIADTISKITELKKAERPTYEIRSSKETFYIHEEDFVYAKKINQRQSHVYFADGSSCDFPESIEHFHQIMHCHPSVLLLRKGYVINHSLINNISFTSLTLKTGQQFPLALGECMQIKKMLQIKKY